MQNLQKNEKFLRAFLGFVVIFLSNGDFNIISLVGVAMVLTAIAGYCPLYAGLHVNENVALENEFLNYLPKNNPEPIFVFDHNGSIIFQNEASKIILPKILSFIDISNNTPQEMITAKKTISLKYTHNNTTYLIKAIGVTDKKFILAYGFNITDIEKSKEELRVQTITDPLTKLGNRVKIIQDIAQHKKDHHLALILIDLVKFSQINSFFGHEKGDAFLIKIAHELQKFQKNFPHVRSIYHLRGNTFALLMAFEKKEQNDIATLQVDYKEKIFALFENFKLRIGDVSIRSQINVALAKSLSQEDAKDLLNHAETALSEVKQGMLHFLCYDEIADINERYKNNIAWAGKLRDVFDGQSSAKISAFFQPIYNLHTKKIEKFECLVRYVDGEKITSPIHFLNVAKQINYLPKITRSMFTQALEIFEGTDYEFSINITTQDLADKDFAAFLQIALEAKKMDASRVVLEILEDEDMYEHIEKILAFKKQGFRIAVDDFGVGYSNFQKLQQLQLDYIKIDASLIKNIATNKKDLSIVKSICTYAKTIGVKTIAEFVADEAIFDTVSQTQIDYAQGYFIAEPRAILQEEFIRE
ncbi:MAG: EAL domain-containing protein [Sulfurospirillum sp.]|nr:EAL domain-containing protein [Sulfurospirillum sp.]